MDAATTSAQRAAALTHRLLAFARRQPLDTKSTDVNALIAGMDDLLRRTLGEQASFEIILGAGLWPALTDFNQLENAILNLALNARDAMPEGGRLLIETANTERGASHSAPDDASHSAPDEDIVPGPYIVISVSDTGRGMSPDILAKAFDPFFTTKPLGQGTGLGLSMIYGFAKQSGAHVRIESTPGRGTTVKLYLPRALAAENIVGAARQPQTPRGQGETVLVVEDDPTVRLLIVEVLNELGYVHHEAADSREALPFLQSGQRIDLMVSDVGLPGISGRQLADLAHETSPNLKVLFVTGYAEGMELLTKPFTLDALGTKIREMIEA
jgi:CheY-like chemotaxis protein